jgi:hypothetical protein
MTERERQMRAVIEAWLPEAEAYTDRLRVRMNTLVDAGCPPDSVSEAVNKYEINRLYLAKARAVLEDE